MDTSTHDPSKPKLSKEEQLKILQERIEKSWKEKAEQAIKDEEEREKNRIKSNKEMLEAKWKLEDA